MFWLRWILFSSPLWLVFGGSWLFRTVAEFQLMRESDAIVHAINRPVGRISPFGATEGIEGEIAELIFEPALRRDEQLHLRPNLIESWISRTVVTIRCESEEAAGEAEARIRAGEAPVGGPPPVVLERLDSVLTLVFDGMDASLETRLLESLPPELLGDYLLARVSSSHSVEKLVGDWLADSVEKSQVRMLEFAGDGEALLFLRGETDRVLRDLKLYLESNPGTFPRLDLLGRRCHTVAREQLIDLRAGAAWHDGEPFTASDLAFSHALATGPDSPLPLAGAFAYVDSLEVLSPLRIRVSCREVPANFLEIWESLPLLPAHRFRDAMTTGNLSEALAAFLADPVGLGPYRIDRRRADGGMELVAHEGYHLGVPSESRRRYRQFSSLESMLLALRTGTLDLIESDPRFSEWAQRNQGAVEKIEETPRFQQAVVWNLDRPPFDRLPVRSALARAFNPVALLRTGESEYEVSVKGLFAPGLPMVAEPMLLPLYDPRGAENLLAREGFTLDEGAGLRRDSQGHTAGFTLLVSDSNPGHLRLASGLAEQWAGVGIEVKIEALPWEEILSARLARRDFDAVLVSWELPRGRDLRAWWHSESAEPGGGNLSGLRDAEVDRLLEALVAESDPVKLTGLTASLQRAIAALQPCLFVCDTGRLLTVRPGAIEVRGPGKKESESVGPGLTSSRPWWVKRNDSAP